MKKIGKITLLLLLIFAVGAILRFYRLGDAPFGFHRDEAFLGYNAYSILLTGKDISGNFLPLHLKSFLYSPAGYSYLSIPFIKLFDLSPFSVRFASAFFGSLTILTTFLLTKQLFREFKYSDHLGMLSAFLLAISSWHINLSRTATENIIVVFFITLGVYFYLYSVKKKSMWSLLISFLLFGVTLFIYQAPRAFLPLFVPLLILTYGASYKRIAVSFIAFFLVICLPLVFILSSKDLSLRLRTVSIFATSETQLILNDHILTDGTKGTQLILTRIFHNKLAFYTQQFLKNYFSHFSYNFLFSDGGFPDRYRVPLAGLLYIVELPLILFGSFKLLTVDKRSSIFLLGWIGLAPLGSALTFDDIPNLQRSLVVFTSLSIVTAFGMWHFALFLKKNNWLRIIGIIFVFIFIYNIFFYLHQYYTHGSIYRPWYRQDGYKELVTKVNKLLGVSKRTVVTDRESAPTIFFLFYLKYSPDRFQQETKGTKMKDFDRISFGQYEFSQEECPLRLIEKNGKMIAIGEKDVLYVDSGLCKIPHSVEVLGTIKRLDNSLVFSILSPF